MLFNPISAPPSRPTTINRHYNKISNHYLKTRTIICTDAITCSSRHLITHNIHTKLPLRTNSLLKDKLTFQTSVSKTTSGRYLIKSSFRMLAPSSFDDRFKAITSTKSETLAKEVLCLKLPRLLRLKFLNVCRTKQFLRDSLRIKYKVMQMKDCRQ